MLPEQYAWGELDKAVCNRRDTYENAVVVPVDGGDGIGVPVGLAGEKADGHSWWWERSKVTIGLAKTRTEQ